MNLFIIPSWYPSRSNPSYGIFIKEQIEMMARLRPEWKIGVSTWGQGDARKLLWAKDHFKNVKKIIDHNYDHSSSNNENGFTTFFEPALSWTKRLATGNLNGILRCNELNFQSHVMTFGEPDVIAVQGCYPGILVAQHLSEKYKIPVHLHIRLGGFMFEQMLEDAGTIKPEVLKAIESADLITATSHFQKESLKEWVKNCQVLHNPVDTDFFKPNNESSEDFALVISRLEEEKGIDMLLESFKDASNVKLKIVGGGSLSDHFERFVRQNELGDKVELLGPKNREEVLNLIQKSRFLILPSRFETFGNVILEAMACGKPVVATRCGGPADIVVDDTGILSDASSNDLLDKITKMNVSHSTFDANKIRKHATDVYGPEAWMNRLKTLLTGLFHK